jgi:hypothetical protein
LIMYLPPHWDFDAAAGNAPEGVLQLASRFPFLLDEWVGEGHTIAMEGWEPFFPESLLTALLLRAPIREDPDFFHLWLPSEVGCHIYWLVPITTEECYVARTEGSAELEALLDEASITYLDLDRASVASRESRRERRARRRAEKARARRQPNLVLTDIRCAIHHHHDPNDAEGGRAGHS